MFKIEIETKNGGSVDSIGEYSLNQMSQIGEAIGGIMEWFRISPDEIKEIKLVKVQ